MFWNGFKIFVNLKKSWENVHKNCKKNLKIFKKILRKILKILRKLLINYLKKIYWELWENLWNFVLEKSIYFNWMLLLFLTKLTMILILISLY